MFANGRESISDLQELIAEVRISELPDYFRIRREPISELPGERRLRVDVWYFDRLPYADLTNESRFNLENVFLNVCKIVGS